MSSDIIVGIESSCDETGVAVYSKVYGALANEVYSQIHLHRQYGGVVPEIAARDHIKRLPILYKQALTVADITEREIGIIAYTAGPGLLGSIMSGASFARSLAFSLNVPVIPIHHMEGHLLSPLLGEEKPDFPFLALLISGGHTQIMAAYEPGVYEMLGRTLDDAVGEAFDKTAKIMGLPYPGGPELSRLADKGNKQRFILSKPMINRPGLDFSFSGLKTQVRLLFENSVHDSETKADIAATFQDCVAKTLAIKCRRAWLQTGFHDLVVSGGVSANGRIRKLLQLEAKILDRRVMFPSASLCTDNALMIAFAGSYHSEYAAKKDLEIHTRAKWSLTELDY